MRKRQPINAEVPAAQSSETPEAESAEQPAAQPSDPPAAQPSKQKAEPASPPSPDRPPKGRRKRPSLPSVPRPSLPRPSLPRFSGPRPTIPRLPRPPRARRRKGRPVPTALKLIAAAVLISFAFVIAAVLGGTKDGGEARPAPAPAGGEGRTAPTEAARASEELGFPAFATSNTTRVGGLDPASNAAGVALAAFPSTADAQRPAAVTLVDEAAWQPALAAAVLTAAPLNAPLLFSGAEVPEPTRQAVDALAPEGVKDGRGAQAFAIGEAAAPDGLETIHVVKRGPAATAVAIAKLRERLTGESPEHFVIAPVGQAGFAMPAAAWAARSGDPVLFAGRRKLPAPTAAALEAAPDIPVYVLGPPSAISPRVQREVAAISKRVRRVAGRDPVANSVAFARYSDGEFGWNIVDPGHGFVVVRDDSPLDAAAAAPLSASGTWGPLLISDDAATLPPVLRDYFLDVKPGYTTDPTRAFYNHVWLIGDQDAIAVAQQGEIDELAELAKIGDAR